MTIAVDFDGTIVEHRYPEIGEEIPFATETLKMLIKDRHRLILWSVREGELLDEAVEWCRQRGVEFYAVNRDYPEEEKEKNNHFSRKLKADLFIDDRIIPRATRKRNIGGSSDQWSKRYTPPFFPLFLTKLTQLYNQAIPSSAMTEGMVWLFYFGNAGFFYHFQKSHTRFH